MRVHKDRPGWLQRPQAAELELHSDPDTHTITWQFADPSTGASGDHWQPTHLMEKVSRWLEEQDAPRSRNQVENAGLGKSRDHVRQAMDALTTEGYVNESPGPRGARMLTSVKPYRTSPDLARPRPAK